MRLEVRPLATQGKAYREFIDLPYRLHRNLEFWVPPLRRDSKFTIQRSLRIAA